MADDKQKTVQLKTNGGRGQSEMVKWEASEQKNTFNANQTEARRGNGQRQTNVNYSDKWAELKKKHTKK